MKTEGKLAGERISACWKRSSTVGGSFWTLEDSCRTVVCWWTQIPKPVFDKMFGVLAYITSASTCDLNCERHDVHAGALNLDFDASIGLERPSSAGRPAA